MKFKSRIFTRVEEHARILATYDISDKYKNVKSVANGKPNVDPFVFYLY